MSSRMLGGAAAEREHVLRQIPGQRDVGLERVERATSARAASSTSRAVCAARIRTRLSPLVARARHLVPQHLHGREERPRRAA